MSEQQKAVTALHEHSDLGLCSGPDPLHRVEKRSYLPPISCTDEHELDAVRKKVCVYRVTHLLANLGWVDFDLGASIYDVLTEGGRGC